MPAMNNNEVPNNLEPLRDVLPADQEAREWGVGRPAASQRLAVLVAARLVKRTEDRPRPDRFDAAR